MMTHATDAPSPLSGSLVRLRAREMEDEPLLHHWLNDPDVTRHLTIRYPISHDAQRELMAEQGRPGYTEAAFIIETLDGGAAIGLCDLTPWSPENRCARLGILIGAPTFRDHGYGTDALRTLCRFGFEMMNLHRIELDVFRENERAIHVYERLGFRREGVRREAFFSYGRYRDIVSMGLLEDEFAGNPAD